MTRKWIFELGCPVSTKYLITILLRSSHNRFIRLFITITSTTATQILNIQIN